MNVTTRRLTILTLSVLVTLGSNVQAQSQGTTLWRFLGIPQGYRRVRDGLTNRRGNHPALERKPPLKSIADPANLESDVPAIKAAAEVKQAEDLKKQKIKAIKYLAKMGCGCYDKDGKISGALADAMDDCTEEVRMAAVKAIQEAAQGGQCNRCGSRSCCKEKVVLQLARLAYERDEHGCWVEPSAEVRQAAAEALATCCPGQGPVEEILQGKPESPEGPEAPSDIEGPEAPDEIQPVDPSAAASAERLFRAVSARPTGDQLPLRPSMAFVVSDNQAPAPVASGTALTAAPSEPTRGAIIWIDTKLAVAHVHFNADSIQMPVGSRLVAYRRTLNGDLRVVGQLEVVKSLRGKVNVRSLAGSSLSRLHRGDTVIVPENGPAGAARQAASAAAGTTQFTLVDWLSK